MTWEGVKITFAVLCSKPIGLSFNPDIFLISAIVITVPDRASGH